MSLTSGSTSFTRFHAQCPGDFSVIAKLLHPQMIQPLEMESATDLAIGWCDPFTGDVELTKDNLEVGNTGVLFGIRVDRKKIPAMTLRLALRNAFPEEKKPSKKFRDAMRERIIYELIRRMPATTTMAMVYWNRITNELWIDSTSQGMIDIFTEVFLNTFNTLLMPKAPGILAVGDLNKIGPLDNLFDMLPTDFVEVSHG